MTRSAPAPPTVPVVGKLQAGGETEMIRGAELEGQALDRIQALALLWAQGQLAEEETMARIIEALEKVGRPILED